MERAGGNDYDIVAQLEDLSSERLGALLRAVRDQRAQSRRDVAKRTGVSARSLRSFERGDASVPRDALASLAAYYAEDLSARVGARVPAPEEPPALPTTVAAALARESAGPGPTSSELGVESLMADLALARLGTLLQSTRVERSDSRRDVASQIGTTARALRRYETGAAPVPRGILTALSEFYGDDLDTHFGHRSSTVVDPVRAVSPIEAAQIHSGDADEVLGAYIGILERLPSAAPGAPVALRADDIAALSTALAVEPEHVTGRIAELLAWTTRLRRYRRIRRRRRILSGAGLVIALGTLAGFGVGALAAALPSHADPITVGAATTTIDAPSTTATEPSTTTVPEASSTTSIPTPVAEPSTTIAPPPVDVTLPPVPVTEPPTTALAISTAATLTEPPTTATTTTTTFPRPVISTDTTPMSIPGTEPITIIANP
jgi:transcriptional regulator with XRE-family HTH domain